MRSLIIAFVSFSYIANLIIASAQIAHRGGLLIEYICELKVLRTLEKLAILDSRN